jgi:polyisoprenoid-binding protein YceI
MKMERTQIFILFILNIHVPFTEERIMQKRNQIIFLWFIILAVSLAACGGQTAEPPQPTATMPATATAASPVEPDQPYPPPPVLDEAPSSYPPPAPPLPAPLPDAYPDPDTADNGRRFVVIPDETEAAYIVAEEFFSGAVQQLGQILGLTDTIGRTNEVSGELVLDLTAVNPLVSGAFTVDLRTLTSDSDRRDNRIRSQWLESSRYPMAEFTALDIVGFPANYVEGQTAVFELMGEMTIREITQPVVFAVTAVLNGNAITGTATTDMRMTDFGFNPPTAANLFTVADEFTVEIIFTARESN